MRRRFTSTGSDEFRIVPAGRVVAGDVAVDTGRPGGPECFGEGLAQPSDLGAQVVLGTESGAGDTGFKGDRSAGGVETAKRGGWRSQTGAEAFLDVHSYLSTARETRPRRPRHAPRHLQPTTPGSAHPQSPRHRRRPHQRAQPETSRAPK